MSSDSWALPQHSCFFSSLSADDPVDFGHFPVCILLIRAQVKVNFLLPWARPAYFQLAHACSYVIVALGEALASTH